MTKKQEIVLSFINSMNNLIQKKESILDLKQSPLQDIDFFLSSAYMDDTAINKIVKTYSI